MPIQHDDCGGGLVVAAAEEEVVEVPATVPAEAWSLMRRCGASGQLFCSLGRMSHEHESLGVEQRLQALDVSIVDVLSHLEALLRHSHSIQRALLQLRSEAPPPVQYSDDAVAVLTGQQEQMQREWRMLGEIIQDLGNGIRGLKNEPEIFERRAGLDRRRAQDRVPTDSSSEAANRRSHTKTSIGPRGRRGKTGATGPPGHDHTHEIAPLSARVAELVNELQAQLTRIAQLQTKLDHLTGQVRPARSQPARSDN